MMTYVWLIIVHKFDNINFSIMDWQFSCTLTGESTMPGATGSPTEGATDSPTEGATGSPTEGATESPIEGATGSPTEGATGSPTEGATGSPTDTEDDAAGSSVGVVGIVMHTA